MPPPDLLPRGVYRLPYLDESGAVLVVAVDSRHRRVAEAPVPPDADERAVTAVLGRILDERDPPD